MNQIKRNQRHRERYATEPEYRAKCIARTKIWAAKNRAKRSADQVRRYWKNRDAILATRRLHNRRWKLKSKYGVSEEEIQRKITAQNECCAVCNEKFGPKMRRPAIDHNHVTNQIRGIPCCQCNAALGLFQDSPDLLRKAAKYLEYWADQSVK